MFFFYLLDPVNQPEFLLRATMNLFTRRTISWVVDRSFTNESLTLTITLDKLTVIMSRYHTVC